LPPVKRFLFHYTLGNIAFTLIELLIVIAVIAVLLSTLLPALQKSKAISMRAVCSGNLRQIGMGMISYSADYNGNFPTLLNDGTSWAGHSWSTPWTLQIAEYLNFHYTASIDSWGPPIFHCPSGIIPSYASTYGTSQGYWRGYMMNGFVASNSYNNAKITGKAREPHQMLAFDCWRRDVYTDSNFQLHSEFYVDAPGYQEILTIGSPWDANSESIAPRHLSSLNYLNKDGSAHSTGLGTTGYGEDMLWLIYTDGHYWQDGYK
jgi:prepilin-type N-terminal cleavage/methylation domain-containing protein